MGWVGDIINAGLGLVMEKHNDKRQIEQQQKLTNIQSAANKDLASFNQGLAVQMMNRQNAYNDPSAQVARLENAGLNVGLAMSPGGGGGGQTANQSAGQAGAVSGGQAAAQTGELQMAMQLGIQKALAAADIKLKESQANQANSAANAADAEAEATRGYKAQQAGKVMELTDSQIEEIASKIGVNKEQIKNLIAQTGKTETEQQAIQILTPLQAQKLQAETHQINVITPHQVNNLIEQTNLTRAQIKRIDKEIVNWSEQIKLGWENLGVQQQQAEIHKFAEELKAEYPGLLNVGGKMINEIIKTITAFGEKATGEKAHTQANRIK